MPEPSYWDLHDAACERSDFTYEDPETGYVVFTRLGLLQRTRCCGAGCRHCPFDHDGVKLAARTRKIQQAAWLTDVHDDADGPVSLLFWSGGKDSFLAFRALQRDGHTNIVLLTTFDARSRMIAHQEFAIEVVVKQAAQLGVPLIGVPLHARADYVDQLAAALNLIPACERLCFGDLHLIHIREWREQAFVGHPRTAEMELVFPLWNADYDALLADLKTSGATSIVSAVAPDLPQISIGDVFDADLLAKLPDHVDPFGENGEFHTRIMLGPSSPKLD
ncbi:Dph6-related ATP pyrophosphatase [Parasphingorhabdus cellanae]|uniref:Dph6-related ATP pyrophosphatase n=1 Tax=Parasphingorhabdus cellanae TaxID=2806553 RepID=UPI001FB0B1F2|nr:DUF5522 domain-containing protein [Parasphingorhabdus cellanae]